jgi:hypothetical protein
MMCKWGTTTLVHIPTASYRGEVGRERGVDSCIAPIVKALNDAGIGTVASCCGHGRPPGTIALVDGRELLIAPDYETTRRWEAILLELHARPDASPTHAQEATDDR